MAEFDPEQHEAKVRQLHEDTQKRVGRVALFEEMMSYVDAGDCTFDQAVEQYLHDAKEGGLL